MTARSDTLRLRHVRLPKPGSLPLTVVFSLLQGGLRSSFVNPQLRIQRPASVFLSENLEDA